MKFIALSDTHGQHRSKKLNKFLQENPADVLLFAGDLQRNNFDDGIDFVDWLNELPQKYKVITFGNHDGNWEYAVNRANIYNNIIFLNNRYIKIDNVKIWGSPYSLPFFDWWFMKPEKELEEVYKGIPDDVDIVMTHTPPFRFLDMTKSGVAAGSVSLFNRLLDLKNVKYSVFGHIHEWGGRCEVIGYEELKNTTFINASILNEKYQLVHDPQIFEI